MSQHSNTNPGAGGAGGEETFRQQVDAAEGSAPPASAQAADPADKRGHWRGDRRGGGAGTSPACRCRPSARLGGEAPTGRRGLHCPSAVATWPRSSTRCRATSEPRCSTPSEGWINDDGCMDRRAGGNSRRPARRSAECRAGDLPPSSPKTPSRWFSPAGSPGGCSSTTPAANGTSGPARIGGWTTPPAPPTGLAPSFATRAGTPSRRTGRRRGGPASCGASKPWRGPTDGWRPPARDGTPTTGCSERRPGR